MAIHIRQVRIALLASLFACTTFLTAGCAETAFVTATMMGHGSGRTQKKEVDPAEAAQLASARDGFVKLCDQNAGEVVPPRPLQVKHLYVYDATENVTGMWGFQFFDDYTGWIRIYKTQGDVTVIKSLTEAAPGQGNYLLKREVLGQVTQGGYTYRGGRQELIDTVSGDVKASRTNYYLGSDFARGVSCLDSNWSAGFTSFITRTIGFAPGFPRSDKWIKEIPRWFVRAKLIDRQLLSSPVSFAQRDILPSGAAYNYNDRQITFEGTKHYMRQTFNNEPLRVVGFQVLPARILASYSTHDMAPGVIFQIRDRTSGSLLGEYYVHLPLELHAPYANTISQREWKIASEGASIVNGQLAFDIIQAEPGKGKVDIAYARYRLVAPWLTEKIEDPRLPGHLDDVHYGSFKLPAAAVARKIERQKVVGQWVSYPVGAIWSFDDNGSLKYDHWTHHFEWKIVDGELLAKASSGWEAPHHLVFRFRMTKDGQKLEVTRTDVSGSYEPLILTKMQ